MKQISTMIEMDGTPSQVWHVLTNFPEHADWNPFFARITGEATVGTTLVITARKGDGDGITFRPKVLVADPSRLLRWKGKLVVPGLFDGVHEFELTAAGPRRTRVDHRESFTGILLPLLGKVLRDTHAGFTSFNTALAQRVATVFSLSVDAPSGVADTQR